MMMYIIIIIFFSGFGDNALAFAHVSSLDFALGLYRVGYHIYFNQSEEVIFFSLNDDCHFILYIPEAYFQYQVRCMCLEIIYYLFVLF